MSTLRSETIVTFDDDVCIAIALVLDHPDDADPQVMVNIHGHSETKPEQSYGTAIIVPPAVAQRIGQVIIASLKKVGKFDPVLTAELPDPPHDVQRN